jgi:two-component system, LytTR family, response regulator
MQKLTNLHNTMYLRAAESYCLAVLQNGEIQMKSRPMKHFEQRLSDFGWQRIHRSFIVNPLFVQQVSQERDSIFLQNGTELPIARRLRKSVLKWRNSSN